MKEKPRGKLGNVMKIDCSFWKGKKVFLTGHTGFKGSWLALWLNELGCEIYGYSLAPITSPNLFNVLELEQKLSHDIGDIRDYKKLSAAIENFKPDIVFHLAAQSLVRYSYGNPIETYETNVMGTVNLLEAVRNYGRSLATIVVTSDKCYENKEQLRGYKEDDAMGGHDPYSNSKGCAELVASAYAKSYFIPAKTIGKIASVRAGNVIGGGDWSQDRLLPDLVRNLVNKKDPIIRNPNAIRPWEHVLEPLFGYIIVAQYLCSLKEQNNLLSWNFGPEVIDQRDVKFIADKICQIWGNNNELDIQINKENPHEANLLYLDCSKAKKDLDWVSHWGIEETLQNTIDWYKAFYSGDHMVGFSLKQIKNYSK